MERSRLDQFVVDIEFLLISVIQGVALGALAANAASPVGNLDWQHLGYVVGSFILILNFWSQAIIHTVSFIDWPIDLTHNFLYILVSFIEVMAFSHMTDPMRWFAFLAVFFLVAAILYLWDLQLIGARKKKFEKNPQLTLLHKQIIQREKLELFLFLPLAILFCVFSAFVIYRFPEVFIAKGYHIVLIIIQCLFAGGFLLASLRHFKERMMLIEKVG